MIDPLSLKSHLLRTWTPFFARHGNFTPVQLAAIPPILDGENVLVISATASGKTEAAVAPLVERHCVATISPAMPGLRILYICPTRALVRDLYERLKEPLAALHIALAMKSGDTGPVSTANPPTLLITTPESTDSLLTRAPRILADLRAVVLDEIHLFDGSPRGDHLRCLLARIEHVRRYRSQETDREFVPLQRVTLSATLPDPEGTAARYLSDDRVAQIVRVPGARQILAQIQPMVGLDDLVTALALRAGGEEQIRKSLIFCNTRAEVEQTAAYLRAHLPFDAAIFTHYSNLDPALRLEVEQGFAEASVALCVCTSTLELGIDIGSIDDVALIGAPPSLTSFLQRIGRGGRRTAITRVLCLPRSPLEEVQCQALIEIIGREDTIWDLHPKAYLSPSVLVQQSFSILKQSPTGGLRLADLRRVAPTEIEDETLRQILDELVRTQYLRRGRPGEWRAGPALDELLDAHEIYSNIGGDPLAVQLVDAYSGRVLAQSEGRFQVGETVQLGGRTLRVVWRDRYRVGVRPVDGLPVENLRFAAAPFAVSLDMSQAVARYLGFAPHQMALIPVAEGSWLFHFWGDVYGEMLAEMLQPYFAIHEDSAPVTTVNAHCLFIPGPLPRLPTWNRADAQIGLHRLLPHIEPFLEMGRFHKLLPPTVAEQAMIDACDLPLFEILYRQAEIIHPAPGLRIHLEMLL
ncbi:MAG: DEAD/DEAH box helicase [Caldilineaceae bacterium]|nr:DEAD/DEAH box helicase [Caldilineaceae bacterium]